MFPGVPGVLYYVRGGQVNDYALSFTLPLRTNVTRLYFDWFDDSTADHPPVNFTVCRSRSKYGERWRIPVSFGDLS